ncbi:unnamed protein product, partial [Owenia fusiformis]
MNTLDYETLQSYTLILHAADQGAPAMTSSLTLMVTVRNVNEFAPVFIPTNTYTTTINENEAYGHAIINVLANDGDGNTVIYAIISGDPAGLFVIDSDTGEVTLMGKLDRETTSSYLLIIKAEDGNGVSTLTGTATLHITINDENDNSPKCNPDTYIRYPAEDDSIGTALATLLCTDFDAGANAELTFSIILGNTGSDFNINPTTGIISLANTLEYDSISTQEYHLLVNVIDGGVPPLTGTASIAVYVSSVNEFNPIFTVPIGGYVASIAEDIAVGDSVVSVTATDQDLGDAGNIKYSILAGNSDGKFRVDSSSGQIHISAKLDRENTDTYTLTLRATDSLPANSDERYTETTVIVTVTDVNDNIPVFSSASYTVSVLEGATVGTVIKQVAASDDDIGLNAQVSFSIISGNTNGDFSIVGDDIFIANQLDHVTTGQYNLQVTATDAGTPSLSA